MNAKPFALPLAMLLLPDVAAAEESVSPAVASLAASESS
jgi:hypothetical protein